MLSSIPMSHGMLIWFAVVPLIQVVRNGKVRYSTIRWELARSQREAAKKRKRKDEERERRRQEARAAWEQLSPEDRRNRSILGGVIVILGIALFVLLCLLGRQ